MQEARQHLMTELADFIGTRKTEITERWVARVYQDALIPASAHLTHTQVVDHVPEMFEEMRYLLKEQGSERRKDSRNRSAHIHGQYRWQQGYNLSELLREMALLHDIISSEYLTDFFCNQHDPAREYNIEIVARRIVNEFFSNVTTASILQFTEERDQEMTRYQEEQQRINHELRRIDESRLRFTRTLSHELRNMMTAIGSAMMVLKRPNISESQREKMFEILQRNMNDMRDLLDHLLDYSTLISGQERLKLERFELAGLVTELIDTYQPLAQAKKLNFHAVITEPLPEINSDRIKVKQIISNLLSNAIKYTAAGSIDLIVRRIDNAQFAVEVIDTGRGMTADDIEQIFDEFHRAPSVIDIRGAGLGLAITKNWIEMLGGTISVQSALAEGSRFIVQLPIDSNLANQPRFKI